MITKIGNLWEFLLTIMPKSENGLLQCMGNWGGGGVVTKITTKILDVIFKLKYVSTLYQFPDSYHGFYFV